MNSQDVSGNGKHIFLMVTSKGCGHCVQFKKHEFPRMVELLKKLDDKVLLINSERAEDIPISESQKAKLIRGYPSFFMIPSHVWQQMIANPSYTTQGYGFNGDIVNGVFNWSSNPKNFKPRTADGLVQWVYECLQTDMFKQKFNHYKSYPQQNFHQNLSAPSESNKSSKDQDKYSYCTRSNKKYININHINRYS